MTQQKIVEAAIFCGRLGHASAIGANGFGWGRRSNICNKYLGCDIGVICCRNQWHNWFRGVRRLRLNTLFFDLAVVAQQTTCVSAMPRDHFGCASWRDKNATNKLINLSYVFIKKRCMMNCFSCVIFIVGLGFVQKTKVSRKITLRNNLEIQI